MSRCLVIAIVALSASAHADPDPLEALLARTEAVAKEVAKIRGLKLVRPIENEVLDRDQLHARLVELASDPKTQTEARAEGAMLTRWGMIPLGTDYLKLQIELLTDQIAGYYDPKTRKLTISRNAGDDPSWAEMVLAHELDHGLQDQHYNLDKFEDLPPSEGDAVAARHALVEGDGVALMIEVVLARRKLGPPWQDTALTAELVSALSLPTGDSLDRAPVAVREAMLFPYRAGLAFVASLRKKQPWSAIDAVFKRPPRSSEQILHPEKYVADEKPVRVELAAPPSLTDYKLAQTTTWGELGFQLFLRAHGVDVDMAAQAAEGWGGDRVVLLAKDQRTIGIARIEWDTEIDAIEAHQAAVRALDAAIVGGTVEHGETRTRWLALDGTVSYAERRGTTVLLAIGLPAPLASAALAEVTR